MKCFALAAVLTLAGCGWLTTADPVTGTTPLDAAADAVQTAADTGEMLGIPYAKPVGAALLALLAALGAKKGVGALVKGKPGGTPTPPAS
jgi:hypothetical protein